MHSRTLAPIFLFVLAVGALFVLADRRSAPAATTEVPAAPAVAHLDPDAYPLYAPLTWGPEIPAKRGNFAGYETASQPFPSASELATIANLFEQYYQEKLAVLGWEEDSALTARNADGQSIGYKNGDRHIVIGYHTAPADGATDVSFFVFSTARATP